VTRSAAPAGHWQPADLTALAAALREVKGKSDPILGGMLVAGADGLVLCAETCGTQVDMLGVMVAVAAGIANQIVAHAGVGESMACLFEGSSGHVAVFPLEANTVLVVFGQGEVSTGRFNLAARGTLFRLREAITHGTEPDGNPSSSSSPEDDHRPAMSRVTFDSGQPTHVST
jgi:predicted regulator of Ras-like GTPase activity (Roadblock/LC7/MglB family)